MITLKKQNSFRRAGFMVYLLVSTVLAMAQGRQVETINADWYYIQGDATSPVVPAGDPQLIGLPHSMSMPYFEAKSWFTGYGHYSKELTLTKKDLTRQLYLQFDGVFQEAEVFINGTLCGRHVGGYTGFEIDITKAARVGKNLVQVRVNNIWKPDVAPRAGEHQFSGGIYRDVRLVKKDALHVGFAGIWVTTPSLERQEGRSSDVHVETELTNSSPKSVLAKVVQTVQGPEGKALVTDTYTHTLTAGEAFTARQDLPEVSQPQLWTPETPALYTLITRVYRDGKLADEVKTRFGFRWFKFTADQGFFLNGKHRYLHGANVHQDQAGWGDGVTDAASRRDVKIVKDAGMDFIRGSHYPHSPAFVQACDEFGICFWSESPFWGTYGNFRDGSWESSAYPITPLDAERFEQSCLDQLTEMIRIHRNSPSIIVWSMSNEPFFSTDAAMPAVKKLLTRLVNRSHELDPTRPAAIGGCQRPTSGPNRIDHLGDIAGYNGDGASIAEFQNPGIPNFISEYGSPMDQRPGKLEPGWGDLARDDAWKGLSWRSGMSIWCAFDHGTHASGEFGRMGFMDYQRLPKRRYFWYQQHNLGMTPPAEHVDGTPARLRLTARTEQGEFATLLKGLRTDGTDDAQLVVQVLDADGRELSNSPDVKLEVISGPGLFPTGHQIEFSASSDIFIRDGACAITFRSYYAGTTLIRATSPGLEPAEIRLQFVGGPAYKEGKSPRYSDHPYVRFERASQNQERVFGPNSPIFASTMQTDHTSSMATDSKDATYWMATTADASPWIMIDTERCTSITKVDFSLTSGSASSVKISTSLDSERWTPWNGNPTEARFIRLSVPQGVGVKELRVTGK